MTMTLVGHHITAPARSTPIGEYDIPAPAPGTLSGDDMLVMVLVGAATRGQVAASPSRLPGDAPSRAFWEASSVPYHERRTRHFDARVARAGSSPTGSSPPGPEHTPITLPRPLTSPLAGPGVTHKGVPRSQRHEQPRRHDAAESFVVTVVSSLGRPGRVPRRDQSILDACLRGGRLVAALARARHLRHRAARRVKLRRVRSTHGDAKSSFLRSWTSSDARAAAHVLRAKPRPMRDRHRRRHGGHRDSSLSGTHVATPRRARAEIARVHRPASSSNWTGRDIAFNAGSTSVSTVPARRPGESVDRITASIARRPPRPAARCSTSARPSRQARHGRRLFDGLAVGDTPSRQRGSGGRFCPTPARTNH